MELETSVLKTDKTHSIGSTKITKSDLIVLLQNNSTIFTLEWDENCPTILRFVPRCNMPVVLQNLKAPDNFSLFASK